VGGPLARLRDGDLVRLDAVAGTLAVLVSEEQWQQRRCHPAAGIAAGQRPGIRP
jgi:dihydroxyacid dehydratase/phosphogluconate dehydratase